MSVWDELTPEQYAVMIGAVEEAYLNDVIYEYNLRVNGVKDGNAVVAPPISEVTVRSLIPRFAGMVEGLINLGWVEIRESADGVWDHAAPITAEQIASTLVDPDTWIWDEHGGRRMVMLLTTDRWDALVGR